MSQTIVAVFVQLAVVVLPLLGVQVGSAELTSAVQTIVVIGSGIWIYVRRLQVGDVNVLGAKV